MKLNVSNELKSRLVHAAENGSVIAKDILSEVKKERTGGRDHTRYLQLLLHQAQADGSGHVQENPNRVHGLQQGSGPSQFPGPEQPAGTLVPGEPDRPGTLHVCGTVQEPAQVLTRRNQLFL